MSIRQKWKDLVAREKEKTKNMTFKKKVEYVAGNWWAEILVALVAVAVTVGIGNMIYNSCKDHILYLAVVDVSLPEEECAAITEDFKAYIGDTKPMHVVTMDTQVSSLGVMPTDTPVMPEATDDQQKSIILVGTGLVDAYICPEVYLDYLRGCDDLEKVSNIMGPELTAEYAHRMAKDGYALDLTGTEAAALFGAEYEPCYLVFTYNNHFPEVTQAFARYLLEKE